MASTRNGSVEPSGGGVPPSTLPPVVGINFGNTYASIAVFTKEGQAECIANEDGERQIACAISFDGEETYIGNPAKQQLVKNAQNTITGFRNLLGKKYSEIPQTPSASAPVIAHPEHPETPAYRIQVLQPSPSPLPTSTYTSPAASTAPTPRSEPVQTTRIITVSDATTLFLRSLLQSAEAFLGRKVQGAVITVPSTFTHTQRAALEKAASDAGIVVLQLLDEAAAAAATTTSASWSSTAEDRTQLIIDLGSSSLSLTLLSLRAGLAYTLATHTSPTPNASLIDARLISHFASDFTKKTKIPLKVPTTPSSSIADKRAEAKLALAIEHTKRTVAASPGAASCSIESLKDGIDYTGSINRLRFDMLSAPIYTSVASSISALLSLSALDAHLIDEVVYVGGSGALPGLDERIALEVGLREDVDTPFRRGTVSGGGAGDPSGVLARGCAMQAALLSSLVEDELKGAFHAESRASDVSATTRTIGVLFPSASVASEGDTADALGGTFIPLILHETALPARRIVRLALGLSSPQGRVVGEVWEVKEGVRVESVLRARDDEDDDDEDDEEEEEIQVKHRTIKKETLLGVIDTRANRGSQAKGKKGWTTQIEVTAIVGLAGDVDVQLREVGEVLGEVKVPGLG